MSNTSIYLVETFSGIRGIWGKGLNKDLALKYGLSFALLLKKQLKRKPVLVIGRDTRPSSKEIVKAFEAGFSAAAEKIIDVGVSPIQATELGVRAYNLDGGVMITASHNPPEFNGWKLLDNTGAIISPDFLNNLLEFKKSIELPEKLPQTKIIGKHEDLKNKYVEFAKKIIGKHGLEIIRKRKFKVVIDPNGGAAAPIIEKFLNEFGIKGYYLNMRPGAFKRKIEPDFESLNYLRPIIKEQKAEFGIGFDCDADRAEIVLGEDCSYTEKHGPVVNGQYLLAILVDEVLSEIKNPQGKAVVTNDCTSNLVRRSIEKYGAKMEEVEVGEINLINKMLELNSPIAGEGSCAGAIFPPSRCRDGILSLAMLLRHLVKKQKSLPEILADYPDFYDAREKLYCVPEKQIQIRENIKQELQSQKIKIQERGGKTGTVKALIDKDSFIFFRASKTEPGAFRIISDAPSKQQVEKLLWQGVKIFNKAQKQSKHN